jgi:hypothetical protein
MSDDFGRTFMLASRVRETRANLLLWAADLEALRPFVDVERSTPALQAWTLALERFHAACEAYCKAIQEGSQ